MKIQRWCWKLDIQKASVICVLMQGGGLQGHQENLKFLDLALNALTQNQGG
jgi:hypothetical protein